MFYDNYVILCNSVSKAPSLVAKEIGLSRASVNGWKNGKVPTDATLHKISAYFNVSTDELLNKLNYPITGPTIRHVCKNGTMTETTKISLGKIPTQEFKDYYGEKKKAPLAAPDDGPEQKKEKPSLELGEPIGAITGIPIIASVKAGYDGMAVEDDTGEYVQIPSVMLRGHSASECRAMHIRGDSMYPNMKDGDIVVVHIQPEVENGKVAVCIVNGDEGTIKRFFKFNDRVELWPDNPQVPKMVLKGQCLESFHIYGQAIALIREDL